MPVLADGPSAASLNMLVESWSLGGNVMEKPRGATLLDEGAAGGPLCLLLPLKSKAVSNSMTHSVATIAVSLLFQGGPRSGGRAGADGAERGSSATTQGPAKTPSEGEVAF